jgi:hypothetical protein
MERLALGRRLARVDGLRVTLCGDVVGGVPGIIWLELALGEV